MITDQTLARALPASAVKLWGDLIRATLWMLLVVGLLTYAAVYVRLALLLLTKPGENDFTIFYYTARMASEGLPLYGDLPKVYGVDWRGASLGNLNPPHFQVLMAPLVPLGYRGALAVWLLVNVCLVGIAWRMTVRELAPHLTAKRVMTSALLIFASAAWTSVAVTGEMSLLLLVPFLAAWKAARHGRWGRAGLWLGVAIAFKPFFIVFPAWLTVGRRWRGLAGAALTAAGCVALGAIVYGPHAYIDWVRNLDRIGWWWLPMNVSLRGLTERMFAAGPPFARVIDVPSLARPLWLTTAAVVAAVTAWTVWPGRAASHDPDRVFPILLVGALLISPLGWIYYLPLVTAPLVSLAMRRELVGPGWGPAVTCLAALALLYVPMEITEKGQPSALATLALASAHAWGAVALWCSLVIPVALRHSEQAGNGT